MSGVKPSTSKRRTDDNLWQNSTTGRWHWEVCLRRRDGSTYRKAGSSIDKAKARASRDKALSAFENFEGRAGKWTVDSWYEHVEAEIWPHELTETTLQYYRNVVKNHISPRLGMIRLDSLGVPLIQEWTNRIVSSSGPGVARGALAVLASLLTRAVESALIETNPARNVKLRAKVAPDEDGETGKVVLTKDEQTALLRESKGTAFEWPVLLGLKFGLRIGESLGLLWSHVDLDAKVIRVRQQAQSITGKGTRLFPPKSKQGVRDIPIPDSLVHALSEGKQNASSIFVSATSNGKPINNKHGAQFQRLARKAGFKPMSEGGRGMPTTHDLRTTFASYMANEANGGTGLKPHALMYLLGHSDISTTMRHYVRSSDEDLRKAMECIA